MQIIRRIVCRAIRKYFPTLSPQSKPDETLGCDWLGIREEIDSRYQIVADIRTRTENNHLRIPEKVILIDISIERAQNKLTNRARVYFVSGIILFGTAIALLLGVAFLFDGAQEAVVALTNHILPNAVDTPAGLYRKFFGPADSTNHIYVFSLALARKLITGGAALVSCYVLAATANSCFREATILLHRRHALRFVRLLSYRDDGNVDPKDLRDAFGVDQVMNTGFDKIKVEYVKDNLIGRWLNREPTEPKTT